MRSCCVNFHAANIPSISVDQVLRSSELIWWNFVKFSFFCHRNLKIVSIKVAEFDNYFSGNVFFVPNCWGQIRWEASILVGRLSAGNFVGNNVEDPSRTSLDQFVFGSLADAVLSNELKSYGILAVRLRWWPWTSSFFGWSQSHSRTWSSSQ